ncbi:myosin-11-like [Strongylocentrotus purpuratus]|uniref:Death domain-containing protein n=1 Tax=Strongylocentrotus purpuratus TaxID=7668 RepID=A0A7M7PK70_STRPU|nr:myosin-11-like [Strongylocentrotus purpuratus]
MASSKADCKTRVATLRHEILSYKPGKAVSCDDERVVFPDKLVVGRVPHCAIFRYGDFPKGRNELKQLGITDMYEVTDSGGTQSYKDKLQLLDLLRGCLYEGDRTLAANDLEKMCKNPRCTLSYEKTKKEVKEAKEANQKMFTEVQEQNQELKKGREEDRERSEKEKRSLAAEMTKKLECKQQHVDTLTETVREKERNETTLRQQVEELKKGREEDRARSKKEQRLLAADMTKKLESKQQHVDTLTETVREKERNETTLTQQVEELKKGREEDGARSEKERRSLEGDMTKKLESKQHHVDTLTETVGEKERNETTLTQVEGREEDRARSEKEKRSLAADMTKKLESQLQHVDTLTEIVGEKERNETTLTQQVEELKRGREEDRVKAEKVRGRSEEAKRSLAEEMRKKLDSKQQHVNTLTETVGNKERNETTLTQQVKELEKGRKQDRARSEKEKRSLAADMTKKLDSQQQRVDTLIETVREKERNETTLRQQVEELKKEHDYKEQLLEQLERETWKLRTKIQLESEIRSAEQKKKAETHQWSFIPWVTSGKQAQGGTSSFEDNSSGGLGRSETLQAGEEPPDDEFAGILQQIADDLYDEAKIDSLAGQLGILHGDIQRALMTNVKFNRVTSDGTRHMLKQWREGVSREDERIVLTKALKAAKLVNLADLYLSTGVAEEQIDDEYANEDVNDHQLSYRDETSLEEDRTKGHTDIQVLQEATASSNHTSRDGHSGDTATKTQEELTDGSKSKHLDQSPERSTEDLDESEVTSEEVSSEEVHPGDDMNNASSIQPSEQSPRHEMQVLPEEMSEIAPLVSSGEKPKDESTTLDYSHVGGIISNEEDLISQLVLIDTFPEKILLLFLVKIIMDVSQKALSF